MNYLVFEEGREPILNLLKKNARNKTLEALEFYHVFQTKGWVRSPTWSFSVLGKASAGKKKGLNQKRPPTRRLVENGHRLMEGSVPNGQTFAKDLLTGAKEAMIET